MYSIIAPINKWQDAIRPAFSLMRMSEEAGIPVRCGRIIIPPFGDAARWSYFSAPLWSTSVIMRLQSKSDLEKWCSRVFVATLPQAQIRKISLSLINAIKQAIRDKHQNSASVGEQIGFFTEFLSRLCFRLDDDFLEKSLNIVFEVSRQNPIGYFSSGDDSEYLLKRILPNLSVPLIVKYLPKILKFGLPNDYHNIQYPMFDRLSDFFDLIPLKHLAIKDFAENPLWEIGINCLIDMTEQGRSNVREEASWRLNLLFQAKLLDNESIQRFGQALWSRCDSNSGLPTETKFYDSFFAQLPGGVEHDAHTIICDHFIKTEIPQFIAGHTGIDNETIIHIKTLLKISVRIFPENRAALPLKVWSAEDLNILIAKAINFWDENYNLMRQGQSPVSVGDPVEKFVNECFIPLLAEVILPNLNQTSSIFHSNFSNIIQDIEAMGTSSLPLRPPSLKIFPEHVEEVESLVKSGLRSNNAQELEGACIAAYYWIVQSHYKRYESPQENLLNLLINLIISAKQPILRTVLRSVSTLVKEIPELFDLVLIEQLLISLEYLIQDTRLPATEDLDKIQEDYSRIALDDRPDYRSLVAHLAYGLYLWHDRMQDPNEAKPDILIQWQEVCKTDILPEVRSAWGNAE